MSCYQELVEQNPGMQVSWFDSLDYQHEETVNIGELDYPRWITAGEGHFQAVTYVVWDRAKFETDLAEFQQKCRVVEEWAGTRAFPYGVTAPNGMKGTVLWAGGEGNPRFYPNDRGPHWSSYIKEETQ